MSDNYRNTPYDGMEEQTMSDKNTPPFNNGDIVRYITSTLIGEERTVSYCRYTSAFLIGEERTVSYSRYTSAFKWRVYFNGDSFDWSDNLELVRPALGSSMPASLKVDNWPMGYCDNGFGHEGEHPLYTSSDNGCKNFITSERLLEIKELFDLTEERDEALAQIENIDYVKRDICNQIADRLIELAPKWKDSKGNEAILNITGHIRLFHISSYYKPLEK